MKRIFIAVIFIVSFQQTDAQLDSIPVYQRFPVIPLFSIMTAPDSLKFTKDDLEKRKATIIFIFSPDCGHCKTATTDLLKHIDLFKKTQIIMVASLDFHHIKKFYEENKIADYPMITMGRDGIYFLSTFYKIKSLPSLFVYNKKGDFIKAFSGDISMAILAASL